MKIDEKVSSSIESYAGLIESNPGKIIIILVISALFISSFSSEVKTVEQQMEDFLPDSEPVIRTFNALEAEFPTSGGTNYNVLIQVDPDYPNSTEIRDVRNPRFLRYVATVTEELKKLEKVSSVQSPSELFSDIPSSKSGVKRALKQMGEARWSRSIAEDYRSIKIEVGSAGLTSSEQEKLADSIRKSIEAQPLSSDLKISYAGQLYIDEAFQNQSQETMSTTSTISLIGVLVVVIILFRSVYYGLNSLLTVIFGIAVGFGIYGILGLNITPQTSGAISLGIGIAVDFGIQPIARYREERKDLEIQEALAETLKGILTPMTLGLIAANIGFLALAFGKLTFLADLGYLLTLTTTMAYLAAFTVIPASIVFWDRYITGKSPDLELSKLYYKVKTR
ncbi:MAG: MMPL family transporter [Candidatus Nanosalina sp.]